MGANEWIARFRREAIKEAAAGCNSIIKATARETGLKASDLSASNSGRALKPIRDAQALMIHCCLARGLPLRAIARALSREPSSIRETINRKEPIDTAAAGRILKAAGK